MHARPGALLLLLGSLMHVTMRVSAVEHNWGPLSLYPNITTLPHPRQQTNRVLAVITVEPCCSPLRLKVLERQLLLYVSACDVAGQEVHVVLVTSASNRTLLEIGFPGGTFFRIDRLASALPVALHYAKGVPTSFLHRQVFLEKKDLYDLFISTEDDIRITPSTIQYVTKWSTFLQGAPVYAGAELVPGFLKYEVPTPSSSSLSARLSARGHNGMPGDHLMCALIIV